ncbi:MAG TPA: hypothetical protein VNN17_05880 [Terriglobia bacterium]|nr:hypothetical protein [Terriglobia bacterium]
MAKGSRSEKRVGLFLAMSAVVGMAVFLASFNEGSIGASALSRKPTGQAQLVSAVPLPNVDGEMCQWVPASASEGGSLYAALLQRQEERAAATFVGTKDYPSMRPVRWIRDPYAAFSAVAVDPINNEVVMTDENLFQIMVYDRTTNTPPTAAMSEPKRVIAGLHTKIEFQCGLYIDPKNGDIYAVNNDTVDTLVIFDRNAKGDVPPTREVYTPHGTFGIAVDEQAEEMFLTLQHDSAMIVMRKYAQGDEAPLRLLQGDATGLADPHGIALDTKNGWIFIANHGAVSSRRPLDPGEKPERENWPLERSQAVPGSGRSLPPSIVVHDIKAKGNARPLRVIQGPKTQFNWPTGLAIDEERGELFVANDMGNSILVFNVTDSGDVAPKRVIKGPKTYLASPTGVWVDKKNNEVWAANFMNHSATVYPLDASGDVAPKRIIRSGPLDQPALGIGNPHPVAYDTKREQILVPN